MEVGTTSTATVAAVALEKWGFPLQELYRLSFMFYKQNSGKAVHLSYEDNLKLIAYKQQASLGPFDAEHAPALGVLDVIGRDRRQHWQLLGSITREQAMEGFIDLLDKMCSAFRPYIEAVKQNRDETLKAELCRMEEEKAAREKHEREQKELLEEGYKDELQRRQLQDALNKQTYQQFKLYAEKQFPGNPEQQAVLIHQLQREHYHQYMQQLHMQNQSQHVMQPTEQQPQQQQQHCNTKTTAMPAGSTTAGTAASESTNTTALTVNSNNNNNNYNNNNNNSKNISAVSKLNNQTTTTELANAMEGLQIAINETLTETAAPQRQQQEHENVDTVQPQSNSVTDADEDDDEYVLIRPAKIWTRPDIGEFKAEVSAGDGDGVITVGHGDTVTVRVPTNINGKCIFWEFATDNYDIGFGIYFEWAKPLTSEVTVHVSDSDEDEDCVDEDYLSTTDDLESGSLAQDRQALDAAGAQHSQHSTSSHIKPPISIIVPIYRRECYNEVYVGSHPYPGEGVYLLKFDNSYSIWRSKTLYYRVYYER